MCARDSRGAKQSAGGPDIAKGDRRGRNPRIARSRIMREAPKKH